MTITTNICNKIIVTTNYECGCSATNEEYPIAGRTERNINFPCNECLEERRNNYSNVTKFVPGCTACSLVRDGHHEYEHSHGGA